jgi:hypothetical protein
VDALREPLLLKTYVAQQSSKVVAKFAKTPTNFHQATYHFVLTKKRLPPALGMVPAAGMAAAAPHSETSAATCAAFMFCDAGRPTWARSSTRGSPLTLGLGYMYRRRNNYTRISWRAADLFRRE